MGISHRIPDVVVDAIDDTGETFGSRLQNRLHATSKGLRLDFFGIGRAHRRHMIGEDDACFEQTDIAIELEFLHIEMVPVEPR